MPRLRLKLTRSLMLFAIPLAARSQAVHEEPSLSTGLWAAKVIWTAPVDLGRVIAFRVCEQKGRFKT